MAKKRRRTRIPLGLRTKERELFEKFAEANRILGQYKKIAQDIANDLARLKSQYVFGKLGGYYGHLGCFEEGSDKVCLHIQDGHQKFMDYKHPDHKRFRDRAFDFEMAWSRRLHRKGIHDVYVGGHW